MIYIYAQMHIYIYIYIYVQDLMVKAFLISEILYSVYNNIV